MRIPVGWLSCAVFFGGRDQHGKLSYRATAFVVSGPTALTEMYSMALVTAGHNVRRAQETYGNTWVRLNTGDGGAEDVEVKSPWVFADTASSGSDVAATPFWPPMEWDGVALPTKWFVTEDVVRDRQVGIGDDLVVVGLFAHHIGEGRNLPIVRSGNVSAMPTQPFVEEVTGRTFDAYLAEVRSIGGLSRLARASRAQSQYTGSCL